MKRIRVAAGSGNGQATAIWLAVSLCSFPTVSSWLLPLLVAAVVVEVVTLLLVLLAHATRRGRAARKVNQGGAPAQPWERFFVAQGAVGSAVCAEDARDSRSRRRPPPPEAASCAATVAGAVVAESDGAAVAKAMPWRH